MRSELANWFGDRFAQLNIAYTGNLTTNTALIVQKGYGYAIVVDGSLPFGERADVVSRPLSPTLSASVVFAWKREQPLTTVTKKFIEHAKCFLGIDRA